MCASFSVQYHLVYWVPMLDLMSELSTRDMLSLSVLGHGSCSAILTCANRRTITSRTTTSVLSCPNADWSTLTMPNVEGHEMDLTLEAM